MVKLLDLGPRFQAAFGFVPTIAPVPGATYVPYTGAHKLYVTGNQTFENMTLAMRTEKLSDTLEFKGGLLSRSGEMGDVFAPPPLITWGKTKNLHVTPLDGDGNAIVERYGDGPWQIRMQGLLVDMEEHQFPLTKLKRLRKFFEAPAPAEVSGEIWDALGISPVYFSQIDLNGIMGYQDTLVYNLTASSIKPVEFYLNE